MPKKSDASSKPVKTASKSSEKKPSRKTSKALSAPVQPSDELAAIVGSKSLPRSEVVSKTWEYIKKNKLQNPDDGREILADDRLEKIFGKKKATMFEMNKFLNAHLKA